MPLWLLSPKTWAAIGAGLVIALLAITSLRLSHAKTDLVKARAELTDPATHKKWKDIAATAATELEICKADRSKLTETVANLNSSIKATADAAKAKIAAADARAVDAQKTRAAVEAQVKELLRPRIAPTDVCEDLKQADAELLESLR